MTAVQVEPDSSVFNNDAPVTEGSYPLPGDPRLDGPEAPEAPPHTFEADPSFFGWLKGTWTFDLAGSPLPPMPDLDLPDGITMTFDKTGRFVVSAPQMVIRHALGQFIAHIEAEGTMRIGGPLDELGRVPMLIENFAFTRHDFRDSTWKLPFDPTFIAEALFKLLTARAPPALLLTTSSQDGVDAIVTSSGEYGHRMVRPSVRCRVTELTFLNEHGVMHEPDPPRFNKAGAKTQPPHWTLAGKTSSASYTQGATIHAEALVTVNRSGETFKLYGISKTYPWLNFESAPALATGLPQKLSFHGKGKLPEKLKRWDVDVLWNVQFPQDELWYHAGVSGPHRLYVTHAEPLTFNSLNNPNVMTPVRMDFIMTVLSGLSKPTALDLDDIAPAIQRAVNEYVNTAPNATLSRPISGGKTSTLQDGRAAFPDHVWGLLDGDNIEFGNCGEATMLMEQMLRLLGWVATQTHVYASSKLEILKQGLNVRAVLPDGTVFGVGPEQRQCKRHEMTEDLNMCFNRSGIGGLGINVGEGCVAVDGRLYCGLINHSAKDDNGRKASHNLLLTLEENTGGKDSSQPCRFQIWSYDELKQGKTVADACQFATPDAAEPQKAPWGVRVPE